MIQPAQQRFTVLDPSPRSGRARRIAWGLALASLLPLASACRASRTTPEIPRRLSGQVTRGDFVPPFAYEAYVRGELLLAQGRPGEAAAQFELATAAPEEDAYLLSRLAYAQALSGQEDLARATLAHARTVDSCSEALWLTQAQIAELAHDLAGAESSYAQAMACAPESMRGVLGLARTLEQQGESARAVELLGRVARAHPHGAEVLEASLELALRAQDPGTVAHAVESWLAVAAPREQTLERAARWALAHDRPELSLRIYEHAPSRDRTDLEAQIRRARGDREGVRNLLARAPATSLGGARATANLALYAGAFERAELEASALLVEHADDDALALRARARAALGRPLDAADDVAAIRDPGQRLALTQELLAALGAPELAQAVSSRRTMPASAP